MNHNSRELSRIWRRTWGLIIVLVLLGVVLAISLDFSKTALGLNKNYTQLIKALIILVVGGLISYILERHLFRLGPDSGTRSSSLRFFVRLVLALVVVLSILAAFGVGISSVVFGGAFFTVIVGLAGQTMFGNLIAGIALVIFRPFDVGNHITFVAWQYPMLMPSYPHDALKPGYSGIVTDVNLMYTTLRTDHGLPMMVPNGIIIQAAIENHNRSLQRQIRFRFDLPLSTPAETVIQATRRILQTHNYPGDAWVVDVSPTTYSIAIGVHYTGQDIREDQVKHHILGDLVPILDRLTTEPDPTH